MSGEELDKKIETTHAQGEQISTAAVVRDVNKQTRRSMREEKIASIEEGNTELPSNRRYSLLLADPPWRYDHVKTESRAIENHYPTMQLAEICELPINDICSDDAILFLWATSPMLIEAGAVIKAWGFTYRTCMVWVKDRIGMGFYVRQQHELLLIATRGSIPTPAEADRPSSVIEAPRHQHSEKPAAVYDIIERMYPAMGKLELFARAPRAGWDRWGNQA